jgi:hypothetical protein
MYRDERTGLSDAFEVPTRTHSDCDDCLPVRPHTVVRSIPEGLVAITLRGNRRHTYLKLFVEWCEGHARGHNGRRHTLNVGDSTRIRSSIRHPNASLLPLEARPSLLKLLFREIADGETRTFLLQATPVGQDASEAYYEKEIHHGRLYPNLVIRPP